MTLDSWMPKVLTSAQKKNIAKILRFLRKNKEASNVFVLCCLVLSPNALCCISLQREAEPQTCRTALSYKDLVRLVAVPLALKGYKHYKDIYNRYM